MWVCKSVCTSGSRIHKRINVLKRSISLNIDKTNNILFNNTTKWSENKNRIGEIIQIFRNMNSDCIQIRSALHNDYNISNSITYMNELYQHVLWMHQNCQIIPLAIVSSVLGKRIELDYLSKCARSNSNNQKLLSTSLCTQMEQLLRISKENVSMSSEVSMYNELIESVFISLCKFGYYFNANELLSSVIMMNPTVIINYHTVLCRLSSENHLPMTEESVRVLSTILLQKRQCYYPVKTAHQGNACVLSPSIIGLIVSSLHLKTSCCDC